MRYCEETDDPAWPALVDCACTAGGIFAELVGLEPDFVKVIGVSDGGTVVGAGAGGIGFFSVPVSDTAGSIAAVVDEEATLSGVAGFFTGTFGETVVLGTSFFDVSAGGPDEATESKDDRYRFADSGSLLLFVVEETSRDFDRDDADGEMEGFGVDTVAGGATGEAGRAGGCTAGWRPVSFSSSVNRLSVGPGPSPTSILEKSLICDLEEAHPPLRTKAPATTRNVQATAHMDFTIPPCKRLIVK